MHICAPPNRVALPQKLINDVRADKARGTSNLNMVGPVRSLSFDAKISSETYEDKRHDDDGVDEVWGVGWLPLPYLYPHRYLISHPGLWSRIRNPTSGPGGNLAAA